LVQLVLWILLHISGIIDLNEKEQQLIFISFSEKQAIIWSVFSPENFHPLGPGKENFHPFPNRPWILKR